MASSGIHSTLKYDDCDYWRNTIVSIDFGTTFSGYALLRKGAHNLIGSDQTPTYIYWKDDITKFGTEAKGVLDDDEKVKGSVLFRHFKMTLYDGRKISRDTRIVDVNGEVYIAMAVFTNAIKYIKEKAVRHLNDIRLAKGDSKTVFTEDNIGWMISIPAISSDSAKQFMREAAVKAGIHTEDLRLVLEPEAASVFCREKPYEMTRDGSVIKLSPGHKYLLADLGGGTADICAHEILEDGTLRELYRATGGKAGGLQVNEEFERFLIKLFGNSVIKECKSTFGYIYEDILNEFEEAKKSFPRNNFVLTLPKRLTDLFEKNKKKTLNEHIDNTIAKGILEHTAARQLKIDSSVGKTFFDPSVNTIIRKIEEIFRACPADNISTMILVGGYSESQYVRQCLEKAFPNANFVLDAEARLAVVKGAAMMGWKSKGIIQRRARYTYGFAIREPFNESIHPEKLKVIQGQTQYCRDVFKKLIQKNQILEYEKQFVVTTNTVFKEEYMKTVYLWTQLWKSTRDDPQFCLEEEGCELVGKVEIRPPTGRWPNKVEIVNHLIVGETEFTVKVYDKSSDTECEAYLHFL